LGGFATGHHLYTTSITQAEILYGTMLLSAGKRRNAFEAAAHAMFTEDFAGASFALGAMPRLHTHVSPPRAGVRDGPSRTSMQIAAIALSAGARVATCSISDFDGCGIKVINPTADKAHHRCGGDAG